MTKYISFPVVSADQKYGKNDKSGKSVLTIFISANLQPAKISICIAGTVGALTNENIHF